MDSEGLNGGVGGAQTVEMRKSQETGEFMEGQRKERKQCRDHAREER